MKCPKCGAMVPDNYRFCTECGSPLNQSVSPVPQTETVKNKALWEVQPGVIAHKISEVDFVNLNTVSGIVVQPGVTAIIYIDGKEVAQIYSGIYNFVEDKDIKAEMDKKVEFSGATGFISKVWKSLVKALTGKKVNQPESINSKERSVSEIISGLNANSIIAVYLKRDTNFPAFFGSVEDVEGRHSFVPMNIRTRILDAEIGVQMFLQVVDFHAFMKKYLLERNTATFVDVQNDLAVYVRNILQEELRNEEIDDYGISQAAKERISARLKDIPQYADGVGFVRIAEISCNNEEFDRYRKLTQELWCSEKELDYLRRTNEFQNRLARENNEKIVSEARNENELKAGLRSLNRDELLSEDEFEAFTTALAIKKFKRSKEAEIEELSGKTDLASAEIAAKTRLALDQIDAEQRIYDRSIEIEKQKLRDAREMNKASLDIERDNADFADERRDKDFEFEQRRIEMALGIDERMNEQEQANLDREEARKRAAVEQQREIIKDKYAHEANMAGMHHAHEEKLADIHKDYTAEQLQAEALRTMAASGTLDAAAQVELANAMGKKNQSEYERKLFEEERARQAERERLQAEREDRREERLMGFMEKMADTNAAIAGAQIAKAEEQKKEYREDARYQQSRVDHTQDKALEYTTKGTAPQNSAATDAIAECPVCGARIKKSEKFCPECGSKLS
ncbi:MAG: zinc-ribbon domain-containing protein [Bacteroidales bacterium]|nr:zinc-ribbon domain-containing protein [Bacteroidales bacterium]